MNGTLTVTRGDHVAIHTHTAAETAWRATSHLIELATQLILVDTPAAAGAHERGARPRNGTGQAHHPRVHQPRPPRPLRLRRPHDVPAYAPASVARLINEAGALQSLGAYALTGHADVQTVSPPHRPNRRRVRRDHRQRSRQLRARRRRRERPPTQHRLPRRWHPHRPGHRLQQGARLPRRARVCPYFG